MRKKVDKVDTLKYNLLKALEKTLGNVKDACEMCKTSRTTYYNYLESDTEFADKVKQLDEDRIDFVESKMFQRIKGYEHKETKVFNYKGKIITKDVIRHYPPDSGLISFFLETKAQHRGYQKKTVIDTGNKDPFEGMTEAEIDEMLREVEAEEKAEAERMGKFRVVKEDDEK